MNKLVIGGYYQHYTGGIYRVDALAEHTETGDFLVIYTSVSDMPNRTFARPASMWSDEIVFEDGSGSTPRFQQIDWDPAGEGGDHD